MGYRQADLTVVAAVDNMCDLAEKEEEEKEGEAVKPHSVGFLPLQQLQRQFSPSDLARNSRSHVRLLSELESGWFIMLFMSHSLTTGFMLTCLN